MKTGRPPANWTLKALESLSVMPASSARLWMSSVRRAASLIWLNDHSYGYDTKGTGMGRMTLYASAVRARDRSSSSCGTSSPPATRRS